MITSDRVIRKPQEVRGVRRMPFQGDGIFPAAVAALREVIEDAEEGGWELLDYMPDYVRRSLLNRISTRVLRVERTLSPNYLFADIEVSGVWVDYDGDSVFIHGEQAWRERHWPHLLGPVTLIRASEKRG